MPCRTPGAALLRRNRRQPGSPGRDILAKAGGKRCKWLRAIRVTSVLKARTSPWHTYGPADGGIGISAVLPVTCDLIWPGDSGRCPRSSADPCPTALVQGRSPCRRCGFLVPLRRCAPPAGHGHRFRSADGTAFAAHQPLGSAHTCVMSRGLHECRGSFASQAEAST